MNYRECMERDRSEHITGDLIRAIAVLKLSPEEAKEAAKMLGVVQNVQDEEK